MLTGIATQVMLHHSHFRMTVERHLLTRRISVENTVRLNQVPAHKNGSNLQSAKVEIQRRRLNISALRVVSIAFRSRTGYLVIITLDCRAVR